MANFEAMITIYSPQGTALLTLGNIGTGSKGYYSLMQHDYIVLKFSLAEPIEFKRGCYVDLTGQFDDALGGKLAKKYYVTSQQTPTYNTSTGGYDYELRLDAYYWLWNNYIFKYTPENAGSEASWSLTATLDVHLGVFLRNLTALGFTYNGTPFTYSIDQTVANKAVAMTYDNTHLLDALFSLGGEDAFDCDVWVTESVIHFGRCELGSAVKIERGVEAESITRSDSKGTFATRIYAFGSTRNIPANYRPIDEQAVVNGVVQKRLMLPNGTPYVDAYENMAGTEVVEDVVVFDDIYPRRVGTLSNVTTRTETVENEDGTQNTYTYYRYKDTGLQFNSDYILEGQELQVTFQSGKMNGMTFGVIFNPDGKKPEEQLWEIVANEDYGRLLPDDTIKPENGDEYVLSGFDIQLVSDQYIPEAEQELLAKAEEYVAKTKVDDGVYTATLMSDWVYADQLHRTFDVGQKVTLVASDFFTDNRASRVIGWEMCLDIPYDHPVYTIGESAQYSRLDNIEQKVDTLTYKGNTYYGAGGGPYVIRTNDRTPASDSNVFSALRALATFLRKDKADTTRFQLSLLGGAVFGSDGFASGMSGFGARIDEDGRGEMESLTVRRELTVPLLSYNRVDIKVGDKWRAPGGGVTASVDAETRTVELKLEDGEIGAVAVGDICMGIYHSQVAADNATSDSDDGLGNRTFAGFTTVYFTITEVTGERNEKFRYQLRPVSERWKGQAEPFEMMAFVAYGNFTKTDRQTSVYETRTYTRMLWKQNTWEIDKENIALQYGDLSNLSVFDMQMEGYSMYLNSVYFTGEITQLKPDGTPVKTANDRGAWEAGHYDYYDRVSHGGCLWLCVAEDGTDTEPAEGNAAWLMQVDKGQDGEPGEMWEYLGEWHEGMHVPYMGVVRYGGATYACVAEGGTDNPPYRPYFALACRDGSLITTSDGLPLLGGGPNPEYRLIVSDGEQGYNGCSVRNSEWADGVEYRNDEGLALTGEGVRYLDVVLVRNDSAETGWDAYQCLVTHTSSEADKPGSGADWQQKWSKFAANLGTIFTSLIIAKNAKIRFLQGNQITVEKPDGTVTAGMSGSQDGLKTRFWAGSPTPDNAPYRVDEKGKLTAKDADIMGTVNALAGTIGGFRIGSNTLGASDNAADTTLHAGNAAKGMYASIGANATPAGGAMAVGRFTNEQDWGAGWYLQPPNIGASVRASGTKDSIALDMDGGCVRGLAIKNRVVTADVTLTRQDTYVVCGNTDAITVTLPSMQLDDDGHVIIIKRAGSGGVNVKCQLCQTIGDSGASYGSAARTAMPTILYSGSSTVPADDTAGLSSRGDAWMLVWVRDYNARSGTYGTWVQNHMGYM